MDEANRNAKRLQQTLNENAEAIRQLQQQQQQQQLQEQRRRLQR